MPNSLECSTTIALWLLLLNCQCVYCFLLAFALQRFYSNLILFSILVFYSICFYLYSVDVDFSHWGLLWIFSTIRANPRVNSFTSLFFIFFCFVEMCLTCLCLWISILNTCSYYHAFLSKSTVSILKIYTARNSIVSLKQRKENAQEKLTKGTVERREKMHNNNLNPENIAYLTCSS